MPNVKYDTIVRDFIQKDNGVIAYVSDDFVFTRALRNILGRTIGLSGDSLQPFSSTERAMEKLTELSDMDVPVVVFVERMLDNHPSTDFIIRLGREFPDIKMIVLTWEATQESVAYLFELGVSRVLIKPASADKVIQDLALTINPPLELKDQIKECEDLLRRGRFSDAYDAAERILMARPDLAQVLVMRGDALMGMDQTDRAVQSYMAAHETRPIFMAPLIKLAEAFRDMDDERALAYLKELDDISPLNPERKIDIAKEHLQRNEPELAETYFDRSMDVAEKETISMVGDLTQRIVDAVSAFAPELAVKYLSRVIDTKRVLGRDDLVSFNRLGIILRGEGRWAEAVEVYRKAEAIAPNDPIILYNMGLAHWEGEQRTPALDCFERALAIDPEFHQGSVGAALNIGSLYLDMRRFNEAIPFFEHVLELNPKNELARKKLEDARHRAAHEPTPPAEPLLDLGDKDYDDDEITESSFFDFSFLKSKKKKKKRRPFTNLEL